MSGSLNAVPWGLPFHHPQLTSVHTHRDIFRSHTKFTLEKTSPGGQADSALNDPKDEPGGAGGGESQPGPET